MVCVDDDRKRRGEDDVVPGGTLGGLSGFRNGGGELWGAYNSCCSGPATVGGCSLQHLTLHTKAS